MPKIKLECIIENYLKPTIKTAFEALSVKYLRIFQKRKNLETYCENNCVSLSKLLKSEFIIILVMFPEVITL